MTVENFVAQNLNSNLSSEIEIAKLESHNIDSTLMKLYQLYDDNDGNFACGEWWSYLEQLISS